MGTQRRDQPPGQAAGDAQEAAAKKLSAEQRRADALGLVAASCKLPGGGARRAMGSHPEREKIRLLMKFAKQRRARTTL